MGGGCGPTSPSRHALAMPAGGAGRGGVAAVTEFVCRSAARPPPAASGARDAATLGLDASAGVSGDPPRRRDATRSAVRALSVQCVVDTEPSSIPARRRPDRPLPKTQVLQDTYVGFDLTPACLAERRGLGRT